MLVSPLTEGLFHRAIAQSPYTTSVTPRQAFNENREFPELDRGSWELVQSLGLNSETTSAGALRSINAYDIMEAYYSLDKDHLSPLSTADGIVIPEVGIEQALLDPQYAKSVPVLSGSNRDEVTLWMGLNRYFVNGDPVLFGLLPPRMSIKNEDTYRYWVDLRSRAWKARGVDQALLNLGQAGYAQLYSYRFDWDEQAESWFISFPKLLGATHGGEIAFVMGAPMFGPIGDYMYPDTDSAQELTDIMMTAWGNFARTGQPGAVAGKGWPPFLAEAPHTMVLDGVADIRVDMASPTLGQLLREIEAPSSLDSAERCLLMWEMVTNIGQPLYDDYARWNNGECAEFDVRGTKATIENALIETYGSTSLP